MRKKVLLNRMAEIKRLLNEGYEFEEVNVPYNYKHKKYTNSEILDRLINDQPIPFLVMLRLKIGFAIMRIKGWLLNG